MRILYDAAKREQTLVARGLDFEDAGQVFQGFTLTWRDTRKDYGEDRRITVGLLRLGVVVLVWTDRAEGRRVISMRKANEDEQDRYYRELDRSG